jgi:hypothetical protein
MSTTRTRRRLGLAAILAAAAIGSAAPAQADVGVTRADCDERLERLLERFRDVEERRGWEAASEWWEVHWRVYHKSCVLP